MRWRILVLDASARQALAACRALGRRGHEVGVAGYRDAELAGMSRRAARYHRLPDPAGPREPFLSALASLVTEHGYEVVVPTDEATIARLYGADLGVPTFPRLDPAWMRVTGKLDVAEVAREAGVDYPETLAPPPGEEEQALAAVGLPAVVKPERSATVDGDRVTAAVGATISDDRGVVLRSIAELREAGHRPLLQQRVDRVDKVNLTVFRRAGRSEMRFTYRVLRDVPLTGGIAMATQTIDPATWPGSAAVEALERVCDAAGYEGVANGEFCVARDGTLYLIEVNARLWGSTWFAERLEQRVVERGVRLALGLEPLPEAAFPVGRRFHHLPGELRWLTLNESRTRALHELLRTTRPRDVFEYDDLGDAAALVRYAALRLARRRR